MGQLFSYFQAAPDEGAEKKVSDPPEEVDEEEENDGESASSEIVGDSDKEQTPEDMAEV
mgnify:CR=1 FL=1